MPPSVTAYEGGILVSESIAIRWRNVTTLAKASGQAANTHSAGIVARTLALVRMTALESGGGIAGTFADKVIAGEQLQLGDVAWAAAPGGVMVK